MGEEDVNMDVWRDRVQQDINDLKQQSQQNNSEIQNVKSDIHRLQVSDQLQNREIDSLKETLTEIKSDTSWIRRKITGAIITAIVTAIVGGIIAYAVSKIFT